jgi:hypothetical protein
MKKHMHTSLSGEEVKRMKKVYAAPVVKEIVTPAALALEAATTVIART